MLGYRFRQSTPYKVIVAAVNHWILIDPLQTSSPGSGPSRSNLSSVSANANTPSLIYGHLSHNRNPGLNDYKLILLASYSLLQKRLLN